MSEHALQMEHAEHAHAHPQAPTYLVIAVVLVVLTVMELVVFYVPSLQPVLVPILVFLAIIKFILVGGFYMHLKFDQRIFLVFFVFPLILACYIGVVLMMLLNYLTHHPVT